MCHVESADAISIQQKNFFILRYGYQFEQFQLGALFLFCSILVTGYFA